MRSMLVVFAICAVALTWGRDAQAQPEHVEVQGQVTGFLPLAITLRNPMGANFFASIDPKRVEGNVRYNLPPATIEVTGETTLESLNKGLIVRFAVEMEKGKAVNEVAEIAVLGLEFLPEQQYGLLPDGLPEAPPEEGAPAKAPRKPKVLDGKFLAIGQITKISKLGITIAYPGGSVNAKVAEDAKVTLQANDLRLAKPGDSIQIEGLLVAPGKVMATRVAITHVEVEAPKRQVPPAAARAPRPGEKPLDDGFGVGDPRDEVKPAAGPAAPAEGPARPKTKGKILKVG